MSLPLEHWLGRNTSAEILRDRRYCGGTASSIHPLLVAAATEAPFSSCHETLQLPGVLGWRSRTSILGSEQRASLQRPLQSRAMSFKPRIDFSGHNSMGELSTKACEHLDLDLLSPGGTAAFWTEASKLLQRQSRNRLLNENQNLAGQIDKILVHTLENIDGFNQKQITQTTLAMAKITMNVENNGRKLQKGSARQILQAILIGNNLETKQYIFSHIAAAAMPVLHKFDSRHLSNFIYAYGLVRYVLEFEDGTTLFDTLAAVAIPNLTNFTSQNISNMLWAYANTQTSNPHLFEEVGDVIIANDILNSFSPQALSNTVWSYATNAEPHPKLFNEVADHIDAIDNLEAFKPQNLSNTVWSYATTAESHPKLFKKVADHIIALDNLRAFNPQALSNTVWSYATADEPHPKLFKKVADHIIALDNLEAFKPQALSNTVWSYATNDEPNQKLFQKVADHIVALGNLKVFDPQALSNTVWSYATAAESHPKLFKKVADHIIALDNLEAFKPQELSNIVWSYATNDEPNPKLFKKVADVIIASDNLRTFKPQELSNTVWSYATAKKANPILFQKVADAAMQRQNELSPQNIANFLWALASNAHKDQGLFIAMVPTAKALVSQSSSQSLANIGWAYAVANVAAPSLFDEEFVGTCSEKKNELTLKAKCQLHQWNIWQQELKCSIQLPKSLQEECYEAFVSVVPSPSKLQDDVMSELRSIGLDPDEEALTKRGYRIDALVEVNGVKIGIEVDGPHHFIGREPTGSTILKHRQVAILDGIQIVSMPYWEWDKLGKSGDKKQKYLRDLLGLS